MGEIKYTELDFFKIKENLKNFLKSQDKFKDYDFDGSSMSILLDILAYNTAYNGFYLNMLSSEMFLDSASLRESVLSRAKHLGYVARSVRTLRAVVDIEFSYQLGANQRDPGRILISRNNQFYANVDGTRYLFVPSTTTFLENPINNKLVARNVELIQGKRLTHTYTVEVGTSVKQRFVVPNDNVDTSTLIVKVRKSSAIDSPEEFYTPFEDLNLLTPNDAVYFLQPYDATKYEIVFGDGTFGKALESGNQVVLDYIVSSGDSATGARIFGFANLSDFRGTSGGVTGTITCTQPAKNFSPLESIQSIKQLAPRSFETQNRAVTKTDYETILKRDIPSIEHLRVWGGEENDPPVYGKVFCAIKPRTGLALNMDDKKRILDSFINPRKILSLDVDLVEPEYFGLLINSTVNYFSYKTSLTKDDIKALVLKAIQAHRDSNLVGFDSDFRHSKLTKDIDATNSSIESNITNIGVKYVFTPPFGVNYDLEIQLNNSIDTGDAKNNLTAVDSSEFVHKGNVARIADDGAGTLILYSIINGERVVLKDNLGSVDYAAGKISINDLVVDRISGSLNNIELYIKPAEPDVIALRNQILLLDDKDISITVVDLASKKLS